MTKREVAYPGTDHPDVQLWVAENLPRHVGPAAALAMLREMDGTIERQFAIKQSLKEMHEDDIKAFRAGKEPTPEYAILLAAHHLSKDGLDPKVPAIERWLRDNPQSGPSGVQLRVDVDDFTREQRKDRKHQFPPGQFEGLVAAQVKVASWADLVTKGVHTEPSSQAAEQLEALKAEYPGLSIDAAQDAGSKLVGFAEAKRALGGEAKKLGVQAIAGPATRTAAVVVGLGLAAGTGAEITDVAGFIEASAAASGLTALAIKGNELVHPERGKSRKPVRDAMAATGSAAGDALTARRESKNAVKAFRRTAPHTPSVSRGT